MVGQARARGACRSRQHCGLSRLIAHERRRVRVRGSAPTNFAFPAQFVEQYQSLVEALHSLKGVQLDNVDTVGTGGNVQWVSAAFAFFLTVIVVEALGRTVANVIDDSEYDRDPREPSDQYMEQFMDAEMQKEPPAVALKTQLELEKYLRDSQRVVAGRESSITFTVMLWALFTFSSEAFNRTPDLPLQP